jgi:hypothetical protein
MSVSSWSSAAALLAASLMLAPAAASAQEPPRTFQVAAIKGKSALSDEERRQLNGWIAQRAAQMSAADPRDEATLHQAQQAAREVRDALNGAAAGFREAFVAAYTDVVRERHRGASVTGAAQLMALLAVLDDVMTAPVLRDALRDERTGVRAAAALGLRTLRPKLAAAGGDAFAQTVAALREAGRRETSGSTLKTIYEALDYAEFAAPDPRASAAALLEVLEARARLYDGAALNAEGAELAGLRAADRVRRSLGDEDRRRYTLVLARLLRHSALRYHAELHLVRDRTSSPTQIELRNTTELMVQEIERQLAELLPADNKPRPSIFDAMRTMSKESDRINLKLRMNDWAELLQKATGQSFHITVDGSG